jgi:ParB-like chromosome segregation protein Spo0J
MEVKVVKLSEIKSNPNNPRIIKDDKFRKLVNSIQEFPKMLEIRPVVVNADMIVLGGNMRLKACKEAGLKEVPVIFAHDLTEDEQKQFIIKDNVGFGEWDWDMLANEWEPELLEDWGLEVWKPAPEIDYSILDDENVEEELGDMADGVRKAIQIEFEPEHYEEAFELVKFWREQGAYVGSMILEYLRAEKQKI